MLTLSKLTELYLQLFHDRGPCHKEISPLICSANPWAGFYMIGDSIMKELTPGVNLEVIRT